MWALTCWGERLSSALQSSSWTKNQTEMSSMRLIWAKERGRRLKIQREKKTISRKVGGDVWKIKVALCQSDPSWGRLSLAPTNIYIKRHTRISILALFNTDKILKYWTIKWAHKLQNNSHNETLHNNEKMSYKLNNMDESHIVEQKKLDSKENILYGDAWVAQ